MTNETTPDAVERQYQDSDGNQCDLVTLCRREPEWAASRLAFERDIIASLRDQLRKVEGERDALAVRMDLPASQLLMVGSELCGDGKIDPNDHRDPRWTPTLQQAAKVMRELTSLRSLLPDARACAEYCRNILIGPPGMPVEDYPLAPVALAARRILAALDSQGGEGECLGRSDARGVAGDRCESGNECGRLGCPECQS